MNKNNKTIFSTFPHISHAHMQVLLNCFSVCSACAKMCMNENRKETAMLCSDCADICSLAIKLHSGDSEFASQAFDLCAQACRRCGEECSKHNVEHCQQCSKICFECVEACIH